MGLSKVDMLIKRAGIAASADKVKWEDGKNMDLSMLDPSLMVPDLRSFTFI